jgi:hypothetical protein
VPSRNGTSNDKLGGHLGGELETIRKIKEWLSHFDWAAIVGSAIVLLFLVAVFVPATRLAQYQPEYYQTDQGSPDQSAQDYPWWQYSGAWVALFTIALTLSTGGLWWITWRTLAHAEKASERQLRAYVGIIGGVGFIGHDPSDETKFRLEAWIKVRNKGQTPAYNMRGEGIIKYETGEFQESWVRDVKDFAQNAYIIPDAEMDYKIFLPFDDIIKQGGDDDLHRSAFVFGRIEYVDSFGEPRWTNFRFTLGGDIEKTPANLQPCKEGNDAN